MAPKRPKESHGLPTILVAHEDNETRSTLAKSLRHYGIHVLEADDLPSMVEIVLTQTRPIHLLIDDSPDKRTWATRLTSHRPKMKVWLVARYRHEVRPDALTPEVALQTVRNFLAQSANEAAGG
jgi:hypothetical protein